MRIRARVAIVATATGTSSSSDDDADEDIPAVLLRAPRRRAVVDYRALAQETFDGDPDSDEEGIEFTSSSKLNETEQGTWLRSILVVDDDGK